MTRKQWERTADRSSLDRLRSRLYKMRNKAHEDTIEHSVYSALFIQADARKHTLDDVIGLVNKYRREEE